MTAIRKATERDLPSLSLTLARSFADDPVMAWFLGEGEDPALRELFFRSTTAHVHLPHDTVWVTDDCVGAAVWDPPGHWRIEEDAMARLAEPFVELLGEQLGRALEGLEVIQGAHPDHEEHWYLAVLGTHPDWQRRGIASTLLAPVLERCDQEAVPAYLESSKESNIAFYRRHGFEVTGTITLPGGGATLWPMWREPKEPGRDHHEST
ncbi:MAG: GNAT family N-acetyltransferase [Acidimicrobiales bacterium]